jgi:hypothetical protein
MVASTAGGQYSHAQDACKAGGRISDLKARKRKGVETKMLALRERVLPLGTYVVVKPTDTAQVKGGRQKITPADRGNRAKG